MAHEKEIMSWNTVKEKYLEFHKIDSFTENMAIDVDFGYWLINQSFLSTLPEEEEESRWISAKDKLPEKDGRYLTIIHQGEKDEVHIDVWLNRLNGFDSFLNDFITHWMPLPEFNPSK